MATGTAIPLIHGPASERLRRIATYASVAVAAVLIAVKFAAWLETGSVSLLSSLVDSLLDAVASLVNLVAVRHAMSPADREHRFGHGKAEPLAVLGQSAFITGSAMLLLAEAVRRLIWPVAVENPSAGIVVMVFSIVVTIGLLVTVQGLAGLMWGAATTLTARSAAGVHSDPSSHQNTFHAVPSATIPSAVRRTASLAPIRRAFANARPNCSRCVVLWG